MSGQQVMQTQASDCHSGNRGLPLPLHPKVQWQKGSMPPGPGPETALTFPKALDRCDPVSHSQADAVRRGPQLDSAGQQLGSFPPLRRRARTRAEGNAWQGSHARLRKFGEHCAWPHFRQSPFRKAKECHQVPRRRECLARAPKATGRCRTGSSETLRMPKTPRFVVEQDSPCRVVLWPKHGQNYGSDL